MINKSSLVCLVLVLLGEWVLAQSKPDFLTKEYDFGDIQELSGPVKHVFSFVNNTKEKVKILDLEASCDCTTPEWSQNDIAPGDTGYVSAQFNPENRPGKFEKSISIEFLVGDNKKINEVVSIEGNVIPKPTSRIESLYASIGDVKFKYKTLNVGRIFNNSTSSVDFDVYNSGDTVISWLTDKSVLPEHIKLSFEPVQLEPGALGAIRLSYDPKLKNDYGYTSDNILMYTDEQQENQKSLNVTATILEYFPEMSDDELAKAPKLSFTSNSHDFGDLTEGVSVQTQFAMINNGQSILHIRKVKSNCSCVKVETEQDSINPGQSIKLNVIFDTTERKGREYKTITVFSNDPVGSTQVLSIKADVK